jgi:cysteine-rich repeat protein
VIAVLNCASGTVLGNTAGRPDSYPNYTCDGTPGGYVGSDALYVFQNPTAVDVTITATRGSSSADFDLMVLDGSGACGPTNACVTESRGTGNTETVRFGIDPGQRFYVAYDVWRNPSITTDFTLQITCTPVVCGDGIVSGTEECEDGNTTNGDGCSSTCRLESTPISIAAPGSTIQIRGELRETDPTWERPEADCSEVRGNESFYRTYTIRNPGPTARSVTITAAYSGDGYLFAFNTPFDPTMPLARCIIGNDDYDDWDHSRIAHLSIGPGEERVIVATEWDWFEAFGPFQLTITTDP